MEGDQMFGRFSGFGAVFFVSLFCLSAQAIAAAVPDGQIIVRIEDHAASRCINSSTDRITMHLRRMVVDKDVGVFTEAKEAGLLVNTSISGEDEKTTPKKVSFPRIYSVTVAPYAAGYVSLPIEEKLFSRFPLTNEGNLYDTVEVEFTIIAKRDKNPFGVALSVLADISKNLPAPINPFSDGFKYFSDYANKVVEGSLSKENNVAQSSKEGKITLAFSSTATCGADQEKTGTLAVVRGAKGKESDGFVNIKKDYCWRAEFKPVFTLKFANPEKGIECHAILDEKFQQVNNPYIAFYLNADPKNLTAAQNPNPMMLTFPSGSIRTMDVSSPAVEKILTAAYVPSGHQDFSAKAFLTAVQNISHKVSDFLSDPAHLSKLASDKSHRKNNPPDILVMPTAAECQALDLTESLRRCDTHGVSPEECF